MPAKKLMHALCGDDTTFISRKQLGDFLPRLAVLPLFADKINEGFQTAAKGASAAEAFAFWRLRIVDDLCIHQRRV